MLQTNATRRCDRKSKYDIHLKVMSIPSDTWPSTVLTSTRNNGPLPPSLSERMVGPQTKKESFATRDELSRMHSRTK